MTYTRLINENDAVFLSGYAADKTDATVTNLFSRLTDFNTRLADRGAQYRYDDIQLSSADGPSNLGFYATVLAKRSTIDGSLQALVVANRQTRVSAIFDDITYTPIDTGIDAAADIANIFGISNAYSDSALAFADLVAGQAAIHGVPVVTVGQSGGAIAAQLEQARLQTAHTNIQSTSVVIAAPFDSWIIKNETGLDPTQLNGINFDYYGDVVTGPHSFVAMPSDFLSGSIFGNLSSYNFQNRSGVQAMLADPTSPLSGTGIAGLLPDNFKEHFLGAYANVDLHAASLSATSVPYILQQGFGGNYDITIEGSAISFTGDNAIFAMGLFNQAALMSNPFLGINSSTFAPYIPTVTPQNVTFSFDNAYNLKQILTEDAAGSTLARNFDPAQNGKLTNFTWSQGDLGEFGDFNVGGGAKASISQTNKGVLSKNITTYQDGHKTVFTTGLNNGATKLDIYDSVGRVTGSITTRLDGSQIITAHNMSYNGNPSDYTSSQTFIDASGNLTVVNSYYNDGSYIQQNVNGAATYHSSQGEIALWNNQINETALIDGNTVYGQFIKATANALSTQFANLLFSDNIPAALSVGAFTGALINTAFGYNYQTGGSIHNTNTASYYVDGHPIGEAQAFLVNFGTMLATTFGSYAGSEIGADFFGAIGLPTDIGSKIGGLVGSAGTQYLSEEVFKDLFDVVSVDSAGQIISPSFLDIFGSGIENFGASTAGTFLGDELSSLIIGDGSEASHIGGQVGSTIGAAVGSYFGGPPGTFIGSFVGDFIGSLFGSLFGDGYRGEPNAVAQIGYYTNGVNNKYALMKATQDNNGNMEIAVSMASAAVEKINIILGLVGGTADINSMVANTGFVGVNASQAYAAAAVYAVPGYNGTYNVDFTNIHSTGYFNSRYFFTTGDMPPGNYANNYDNAEKDVGDLIIHTLRTTPIVGGNEFMKLAIQRSSAINLNDFISDLNAASDYSLYVSDPLSFDVALATASDATSWQNWNIELTRIQAMGLDAYSHGTLVLAAPITQLTSAMRSIVVNGNVAGNDVITPAAGSTFSIILAAGLNTNSYWFSRSGNNLVMNFFGSGHTTTIQNWYAGNSDLMQSVVLADGTAFGSDIIQSQITQDATIVTIVQAALTPQIATLWDSGIDAFGTGLQTRIIGTADGHLGFIQYDNNYGLLARQWFTDIGSAVVLPLGANIVAASQTAPGTNNAVIIKNADGTFQKWSINASGDITKGSNQSAYVLSNATIGVLNGRELNLIGNGNKIHLELTATLTVTGDNTIYSNTTNNIFGTGNNTIVLSETSAATISLSNTADQIIGAGIQTGIRHIDGTTSTASLSIFGDAGANIIKGGTAGDIIHQSAGADQITGGLGDDIIFYDAANASIDGGENVDWLCIQQGVATTINLANVADQVVGGGITTGFENVDGMYTSSATLTIFGDARANFLRGGSGNDWMYASAGGDQRYGGAGEDIVIYSATDSITDGEAGTDWLAVQQGSLTVNLGNVADQTSGDAATVLGFENVDGLGNSSVLNFTGDGGANFVRGGIAADTLSGGGGNDIMYYDVADISTDGGAGIDTLYVNDVDSRAFKPDVAVTVNLQNAVDQITGGGVTTGFENVDGSFSTVALSIAGDNGTNTLRGGSAADIIYGSWGGDQRYGGDGNDIIYYHSADVITDAGAGTGDKLVIYQQSAAITVNLNNAADQVVGGGTTTGFEHVDGTTSTGVLTLTGDAGYNSLRGGSANDIIVGGGGADTLYGNGGDDTITYDAVDTSADGGAGVDSLVVNQTVATTINLANAVDQVTGGGTTIGFENIDGSGSTAALTMFGDAGANILRGGSGNDWLYASAGGDQRYGGTGDDIVIYSATDIISDGGVGVDWLAVQQGTATINLNNTADQSSSDTIVVTGFENLDGIGNSSVLNFAGDNSANFVRGGIAADTLSGGGGNDTMFYDAADISTDGGTGIDTLYVNDLDSRNYKPDVAVTLNLQNTADQIIGGGITTGFENVDASFSTLALTMTGDAGANILKGGAGDDIIDGAGGADNIQGGTGTDYIYYDAADISADAGAGVDILMLRVDTPSLTINLANTANQIVGTNIVKGFEYVHAVDMTAGVVVTGDANNNTFNMGSGNDTLDGVGGIDVLYGNGGDDRIVYDAADAASDGGSGNDTLVVNRAAAVSIDLRNADQIAGDVGSTANFENVDGIGSTGALTIIGNTANSFLRGGSGVDVISDAGGDDIIDGMSGADSLYGNTGNDTITFDASDIVNDGGAGLDTLKIVSSTAVNVNLSATANQVTGSNVVTGFENIDGSASTGVLTIMGDAGSNILSSGSYDDVIDGGAGSDSLYGNGGNDTMTYDAADIIMDAAAGQDALVLNQSVATTVDLSNAVDQIVGGGITIGFDDIVALGSTADLTLTGTIGGNTFRSGSGNDMLNGGSGGDWLYGNAGNDTIVYDAVDVVTDGGTGLDTLIVNQTVATTVNFANVVDQVVGGGVTTGFENIDGTGSNAVLTLFGDASANVIKGGSAQDWLYASAGGDQRYGGAGDDIIIYSATDVITDGGSGNNWLAVQSGTATINLSNVADQSIGDTPIVTGMVNLDGLGNTSALTFIGDNNANFIRGGIGADTLSGGGGDDAMYYDAADISMDGGIGVDTLWINDPDSRAFKPDISVTINLANIANQVTSGTNVVTGFQNVNGGFSTAALIISGDNGINIIRGGSGNDIIYGSNGGDQCYGGDGNDTIYYNTADAITDGGAGTGDKLIIYQSAIALAANLSNAADQVVGGGITTGFEHLDGSTSTGMLTLTGDSNSNSIRGGSAGDIINGGAAADTLFGNGGDDFIAYDEADTSADGGTGLDTLIINQTVATTVNLANVVDQVVGGGVTTGFENIDGTGSNAVLTLFGDASVNTIFGGLNSDSLDGGIGADTLIGNDGDDTITYDAADATEDGGSGVDTLVLAGTVGYTINLATVVDQVTGGGVTTGFENINGSSSTATLSLRGDAGANIIKGGTANDGIVGGSGADSLYGNGGNDTISYDTADLVIDGGTGTDNLYIDTTIALTIDLSNVADQVIGGGVTTGFENVDGTWGSGALTITGDTNANTLFGSSVADTINGGDGNDAIRGLAGADSVYGGNGSDWVLYDAADSMADGGAGLDTLAINTTTAITIDLASITDQVAGGGITIGFETIDGKTSTGALTITGDAGANYLFGGSAADIINGGNGINNIDGGAGADRIYGGNDQDYIVYDAADIINDGGAGSDDLLIKQSISVTIDLAAVNQVVGSITTVIGFEHANGQGSTAALTLFGSGGNNYLYGGSAADNITGRLGNDMLYGGAGNDTYNFTRGDGFDTIFENDSTAGNTDYLKFASGINYDQLWFRRSGNGLVVDVLGTTDKILIDSWYLGTNYQVESIQAGGKEIYSSAVANLVTAMAAMTEPGIGQTTLTAAQHAALDPVIAANWHAA